MTSTTSQSPVVVGYQDHASDRRPGVGLPEAARRGAPVRVLHAYAVSSLPWGYGYPLPVGDLASVERRCGRARPPSWRRPPTGCGPGIRNSR